MMSLLGFLDIPGGDRIRSNRSRKVGKHVGIIERQVTRRGFKSHLLKRSNAPLEIAKLILTYGRMIQIDGSVV